MRGRKRAGPGIGNRRGADADESYFSEGSGDGEEGNGGQVNGEECLALAARNEEGGAGGHDDEEGERIDGCAEGN